MTIHVLRHGKTLANEQKLFCGSTDLPLSPTGIMEIEQLKNEHIYPEADLFFASGLQRAQQTVDLIYGEVQSIRIPELNEYDFGSFEMKTNDELKDLPEFKAWLYDKTGLTACPDGECSEVFKKRIISGFKTVAEKTRNAGRDSAILVCHGGVIVHIMQWLFPDMHNYPEWQPDPGRGYTIEYEPEKPCTYNKI